MATPIQKVFGQFTLPPTPKSSDSLTGYQQSVNIWTRQAESMFRQVERVLSNLDTTLIPDSSGGGGSGLYWSQSLFDAAFDAKNTDALDEGVTHLYFTTARARASVSATSPLSYNSGTGVFSIADAAADGTTKGAATFTTADFNAVSGLISIDYANGQKATGAFPGFLTAADWTTFNNKQNALTFGALTAGSSKVSIGGTGAGALIGVGASVDVVEANLVLSNMSGTLGPTHGGTGLASYVLGDVVYASAANVLSALAGNITTTKKFLRQTGSGAVSAAPAWDTLVAGDIPDLSGTYLPLTGGTLTGLETIQRTIGSSLIIDGLFLQNPTAATNAAQQQNSPSLHWRGAAWKSTATAASEQWDFTAILRTTPGTSTSTADLVIMGAKNAGYAIGNAMVLNSGGLLTVRLLTVQNNGFNYQLNFNGIGQNQMFFGSAAHAGIACYFSRNNAAAAFEWGSDTDTGDYRFYTNGGLFKFGTSGSPIFEAQGSLVTIYYDLQVNQAISAATQVSTPLVWADTIQDNGAGFITMNTPSVNFNQDIVVGATTAGTLYINSDAGGLTYFPFSINGGDAGDTPSNVLTPAGWLHGVIDGTESWIPYYR